MPFYNNKRDIEKAIISVLSNINNSESVELILVDDCSSDGTSKIVKEYVNKYNFIKLLVNDKNLGPAGALKRALQSSKGEIIIFSAADDISYNNRLTEVMNVFRSHPEVGVVISEAEIIDEEDEPTGEYFRLPSNMNLDNAYLYQLKRNYCLGAAMAIRNRQDIFAKGGFLELVDDFQIGLEYILAGLKIYPLKKPLLKYRVHKDSVSYKKNKLHQKTLSMLKNYNSTDFEETLSKLGHSQDEIYLALSIFELFKGNESIAEGYLDKIQISIADLDFQSQIEYYFYKGIIENSKGSLENALLNWEKVLHLQPDNFVVLNNLGVLLESFDKNRALKLIKKACEINPNYIDGNNNLKAILNNMDDLKITQRLLTENLIKKENYLE